MLQAQLVAGFNLPKLSPFLNDLGSFELPTNICGFPCLNFFSFQLCDFFSLLFINQTNIKFKKKFELILKSLFFSWIVLNQSVSMSWQWFEFDFECVFFASCCSWVCGLSYSTGFRSGKSRHFEL